MHNEKLKFRIIFSFLFSEKNDSETIRYSSGIDVEISDKLKKKYQKYLLISWFLNSLWLSFFFLSFILFNSKKCYENSQEKKFKETNN